MSETQLKPIVTEHCCECAQSEDAASVLIALIEAASVNLAPGEQIPHGERAELAQVCAGAREFLIAMWKRKKPSLEMPRL